ncbi:MAG: TetR family transcriptional regulator [Thermogemmatispora sp.]|uniref:TetR family transcriptional regulator n=1 Tax=Thermogemmatispora sp. TaxID=1968838 RepID=UPI0026325BBD|nr:TetR family transcriptional regulator [Thermogemmatispora sp.]MBX5456475.1 TetR family transcriptional regulator [Thermogemmatispora sp.]
MSDTAISQQDQVGQPGLRERKKRLLQEAIEQAALKLFLQRGYEQTSIQDIAETVMISPRTFFRYFPSKEEVLLGPTRTVMRAGLEHLRTLPKAQPEDEAARTALRSAVLHIAHLYQQQRYSFLLRYQIARQVPSVAAFYLYALLEAETAFCHLLQERVGGACEYSQLRLLVATHVAILRVALEQWLDGGAQGDLQALLLNYLEALH